MRHSLAHVLAQAVLKIYPGTRMGIGPAIENGFYYDFDIPGKSVSSDDLAEIEEEMHAIIEENLPFKQILIPRDQAFDTLLQLGQIYKTELLQQVTDEDISFFKTGEDFIDLCRGPHVKHTGELPFFKLTKISGAYWMGDQTRPQLQRIQGVAFKTRAELEDFLLQQEELKEKDHRKIGKDSELFYLDEQVGSGLPILLGRGFIVKRQIEDYVYTKQHQLGFRFIESPEIAKSSLFQNSGQLNYSMQHFFPALKNDSEEYLLGPDTFNFHILQYKFKKRSYRELPLKSSEFATIYKQEKSGELSGLITSRRFTQVASFVFCEGTMAEEELKNACRFILQLFTDLGFDEVRIRLNLPNSEKPASYIINDSNWKKAIAMLKKIVRDLKLPTSVREGGAQYYGPELTFVVKDRYEREWDLASITLDLNLPQSFQLSYVSSGDKELTPTLIHIRPLISIERLLAVLTEHYGLALPLWLAPTQVRIISIGKRFNRYAEELSAVFAESNIRTELDLDDNSVQSKIRDAQMQKVPYMVIVGEKEVETESISVRPRSGQDIGLLRVEEFITRVLSEISNKS